MFFLTHTFSSKKRLQSPVIVGWGDCRTCSFIEIVCRGSWCPRSPDGEIVYTCCWDCDRLKKCIEEINELSGGYLEKIFEVTIEELWKGVKELRKRMKEAMRKT